MKLHLSIVQITNVENAVENHEEDLYIESHVSFMTKIMSFIDRSKFLLSLE